jgi:hypothetical protein
MYLTIGTLQKKIKNLTLTVREFNKRIIPTSPELCRDQPAWLTYVKERNKQVG